MLNTEKETIYYGWKIVYALLIINTFVSGLSFYNHAVILNVLSRQPQFTVQSVSLAVSLFFLSGGFTGLWVARLLRDFDPRYCICIGAVAAGGALSALALVDTVWQLYALYILFGMGFCASGLVPATTLVTRWFHKKRAIALSISSTGLSLGGVLITPFCAILVESVGLAKAAPVMGAVYIVGVVPVALLWLRPGPESLGLAVDGDSVPNSSKAMALNKGSSKKESNELNTNEANYLSAENGSVRKHEIPLTKGRPVKQRKSIDQGIDFDEAMKGRIFWAISISYIFLMLAQVGGIAHQYGLAKELLSEAATAMAVAILPIASIIGRLAGGWVVGQMSIRTFAITMMLFQGISLGLLSLGSSVVLLCIGLGLFGVTVGNLLMLQPLLIAEAFGVKNYARIFSITNLLSSFGTAGGPALLGLVYTASSDQYSTSYLIAAIAGFIGMSLFISGGDIRVRQQH